MVAGVVERAVIGVDLGGTKLLAGAVDADLAVHHRTNRPVLGLDQNGLVQMVADAVEEVRTAVGGDIVAVGFGIPCTFDRRTGVAIQAVNAPLHDIVFHEVMASRLGLPVVVDNDANCAALCEVRVGVGAGCSELVLLTLGTGIGGGLVLGGEVYRGWLGGGAEMGHMVVVMDGPPCQGGCPNRGCLESVASGTALVREASLAVARRPDTALGHALEAGRELTGPLISDLAREGDPVARDAIALVGHRLGVGIVSLVNIFNPEIVVIGGGVSESAPLFLDDARDHYQAKIIGGGLSEAGDLLLDPARQVVAERALSPNKDVVRIEAAAFGAEAGMIGAALMARDGTGIARAGFDDPRPSFARPADSSAPTAGSSAATADSSAATADSSAATADSSAATADSSAPTADSSAPTADSSAPRTSRSEHAA
jgi:glucokinase